jgi:hypothetical protein
MEGQFHLLDLTPRNQLKSANVTQGHFASSLYVALVEVGPNQAFRRLRSRSIRSSLSGSYECCHLLGPCMDHKVLYPRTWQR